MSSLYYLGVGVCSLAISIYNFNVYGIKVQCQNKVSVSPPNIPNIFAIMIIIIAVVFILLFAMSIFLSCVINSLSNQLPEDFINIGAIKKFLACFCKIFPPIILILSWINFILIIVIWILYVTKHCYENDSTKVNATNETKYFRDVRTLNIVNSIIWVVLHYGGSIIRDMTYQEPFMYSPDTGKPNCCRTLMLKKLGP